MFYCRKNIDQTTRSQDGNLAGKLTTEQMLATIEMELTRDDGVQ